MILRVNGLVGRVRSILGMYSEIIEELPALRDFVADFDAVL